MPDIEVLGVEDRLGNPLGIVGFFFYLVKSSFPLGMEDRLGSPLGIAGFENGPGRLFFAMGRIDLQKK